MARPTQSTQAQPQGVGLDAAVDQASPTIVTLLDEIEAERDLRIIYACESGSRAWGFASHNSDFDVRFIFVRPVAEYLRLRPLVDAFDLHGNGDIDAAGWDIRKTAELMRRSNPPLLEWLDSPIVYRADDDLSPELISLRDVYFDPKKAAYHYLSLAAGVWKKYIEGNDNPARKKYLYVVRPLACIRFIEMHRTQPPTKFEAVLNEINWPDEAHQAVRELVHSKKRGDELGAGPADTQLNTWIRRWLDEAETLAANLPVNQTATDRLDNMIRRAILGNA